MSNESNFWGKIGAGNPGLSEGQLRQMGASGDQAAEARAAQERARQAQQNKN